ncbi:MAG TPA: hypothetical protein VGS19_23350 [Streptosporangiaceae bacterium]|nr:hypothetical protein [Streptosporangiaceae bacterium]
MEVRTGLRRLTALAGIAAAPVAPAFGAVHAKHAARVAVESGTPQAAIPADALARVKAIAKHAARTTGDWMPAQVTVVATTHAKAAQTATSEALLTDPVYLVTMRGHFTGDGFSPASSVALPTGTYLSFMVDARSFQVMDVRLSDQPPTVSAASLGPLTSLSW